MGDLNVKLVSTRSQLNTFTRNLLRDIHGMERMLEEGWFNEDPIHIGAEQEICIVDNHYKPAPKSLSILESLGDSHFTTELAKFNIEANLDPLVFEKNCFSVLENTIDGLLEKLSVICSAEQLDYVLTGILPTIRKFDLEIGNLTPLERYHALMEAISKMRGKIHELHINGIDELNIKHDSAMLESCNTSFQVHLQVRPDDFVRKYNISQVLAGPVLALAVNSPLLFGKRLWAETRVALFQQSIDTRVATEHIRDRSARVMFGNSWLAHSIVEMYKEDIVRFRIMLMTDTESDVLKKIDNNITPELRALMIHNSTVYRWNRPCYGISPNGRPHLRVENRVLPSGPSVLDEVANAAFWIGMMNEFDQEYPDVTQVMEFDHAKDNFLSAARDGLNTDFTWIKGKKISIHELVKKELLPIARAGLERNKIDKKDIDRYLSVIEERNEARMTGTQWMINSHNHLMKTSSREEVSIALTASMIKNQKSKIPVHKWKLSERSDIQHWQPYAMLVEEFMTTDLFTVQQDDIPELVSDILSWKKIKHVPVEDDKGRIKGLMNYRLLLQYYSKSFHVAQSPKVVVKDLMIKNPITIHPEATIEDALKLMRTQKIDCLPVVKNDRLIGIITEGNFINITMSLLKSQDDING
ncbi:MAG: CBS domain-containing protein/gamma-glutamylcysteine synthetase [Cyclobacteriaceae bacterium]|jgi:CBS domain-containing protein/gamma-glutamylcysteine synthetase